MHRVGRFELLYERLLGFQFDAKSRVFKIQFTISSLIGTGGPYFITSATTLRTYGIYGLSSIDVTSNYPINIFLCIDYHVRVRGGEGSRTGWQKIVPAS
jgi:hypothetical protein